MELIIIIIIIISMEFIAFTPPSPTAYYYRVLRTIHNPFFVGALVATSIHTAVMYDAP